MAKNGQSSKLSNIIKAFDPSKLKLTNYDDLIYKEFKQHFKNISIERLNEQDFKSEISKAKWRPFCNYYKGKIDEFNFGTLLRIDCNKDYSKENTILVTRIQFYAVEIARNRQELNKLHLNKEPQDQDDSQER
ncbi:protein PBDC1 [Exaiptasia diaphana]|uniref:Polysaccharide biosynthesis domain-containing protein n=1 Tax=Exaiptasia diaphana TaxID=2652724 RepID=A0A913X118_EXADI|nr:protein PBDC1 [Exaiptasia diaphana]